MSQKTHPRLVGAFVLGAIALVLAAIVLLSSGNWFEPRSLFAVFFPGSVRGLNQGSAVTFRGVRIGEVKDVNAFISGRDDLPIQIEVVIEVRTRVVEAPEGAKRPFAAANAEELARELIARGVRARMLSQSLLTGQKYIELDFLPDQPARFSGMKRLHPELPTTPTAMEQLGDRAEAFFAKLAELPMDEMLDDLRTALQSLSRLLSSPELAGAVEEAHRTTRGLVPLVAEARETIADARRLVGALDGRVNAVGGEAETAMREMRDTLDQVRRTLETLDRLLARTDDARVGAAEALEELSRALRSLRQLVDLMQAHPEVLLQGKKPPEEKK